VNRYDYLIAGGGCAGLSLALQMARAMQSNASILVVDRVTKNKNDRSWAFWSSEKLPLGLDSVVSHRWSHLNFVCDTYNRKQKINPFTYQFIRGLDYYNYMYDQLLAHPNVHFLTGEVQSIRQSDNLVQCWIDNERYTANRVFDSRVSMPIGPDSTVKTYSLWQHFGGQFIRTKSDVFDENCATLMDFRVSTAGQTAFYYVLPFSAREALVEYTVFTQNRNENTNFDQQIGSYLRDVLDLNEYEVTETEKGAIPMTNRRLDLPIKGDLIHPIGTAANQVKSTTGYAFLRIHAYNAAIVQAVMDGQPIPQPFTTVGRFAWYDQLLLNILTRKPELGEPIFQALFKRVDFSTILRFLDEDSSVFEEGRIFSQLPIGTFLEAVVDHHLVNEKDTLWDHSPIPLPDNLQLKLESKKTAGI